MPSEEARLTPAGERLALNDTFLAGFKYEIGNRRFALLTMKGISSRLTGDRRNLFWNSYYELEKFNQPRYAAAAQSLGVDASIGWGPQFRGRLIGSTPLFLLGALTKYVYPKTIAYLDALKAVQAAGPDQARSFLAYMIEQEELQIEMMRLALADEYEEIPPLLADFLKKQRTPITQTSLAA